MKRFAVILLCVHALALTNASCEDVVIYKRTIGGVSVEYTFPREVLNQESPIDEESQGLPCVSGEMVRKAMQYVRKKSGIQDIRLLTAVLGTYPTRVARPDSKDPFRYRFYSILMSFYVPRSKTAESGASDLLVVMLPSGRIADMRMRSVGVGEFSKGVGPRK